MWWGESQIPHYTQQCLGLTVLFRGLCHCFYIDNGATTNPTAYIEAGFAAADAKADAETILVKLRG